MSRRAAAVEPHWGWSEFLAFFREKLGPYSAYERGYADWLADSPDLRTAVDRAVRSRMPDGTHHNHQSKVKLDARLEFGRRITETLERGVSARTFHQLWLLCHSCVVPGIGPLTIYDVAERIGRYLRLRPDRVYLHAGTKLGAEALGIDCRNKEWLMMDDLPAPMRSLYGDEAEDFLCVFSSYFDQLR